MARIFEVPGFGQRATIWLNLDQVTRVIKAVDGTMTAFTVDGQQTAIPEELEELLLEQLEFAPGKPT